jgi:pyridoxamine-phosphate oxidase
MDHKSLSLLRKEYRNSQLNESDLLPDPFQQFNHWFQQALAAELPEPNAMTLATVNEDGHPSARIVLLKEMNSKGFVFFTNYQSRKGEELEKNPFGAIVFFWHELERQVRIEGKVEKISAEESDNYFHSRPRDSRIGAIASPQSKRIASRQLLEDKFSALIAQTADSFIDRPIHWGGYVLIPQQIEFWQGRPNRMHDRLVYSLSDTGVWEQFRVAP